MKQNEGKKERKSLVFRFLNTVEQVGNRLPHPITMFAALALFIVFLSGILAAAMKSPFEPICTFCEVRAKNVRYIR